MRVLEPEVVDAIWQAIEAPPAPQVETHSLGFIDSRPDRLCARGS
jgi:hypothetical protein